VSGFLYQSGKLSFDETDYEFKEQKSFKTNFASNLTGLKDLLGDMTIQELFQDSTGAFDQAVKIDWNKVALQSKMQSITNVTLGNGISLKHGVPFVSNKRVWTYDSNNLSVVDNISFKLSVHTDSVNAIQLDEVRPAISYMTIMEHLLLKMPFRISEVYDRKHDCSGPPHDGCHRWTGSNRNPKDWDAHAHRRACILIQDKPHGPISSEVREHVAKRPWLIRGSHTTASTTSLDRTVDPLRL
jgi:hypothetical protein